MDNGASSYRRFLEGEKEAFGEIVDLYRESLIFFLRRYVDHIELAEDLAEDAFAELIIHPSRYGFKSSLKTYLFAVGRNKAIDYLRRKAKWDFCHMDEMAELADLQTLEETVLDNEEKRQLNRALENLPADYRRALHLVFFEDLSYKEAAYVMKKSRKQVENLVYRGKLALREILEKEGFCGEEQG